MALNKAALCAPVTDTEGMLSISMVTAGLTELAAFVSGLPHANDPLVGIETVECIYRAMHRAAVRGSAP